MSASTPQIVAIITVGFVSAFIAIWVPLTQARSQRRQRTWELFSQVNLDPDMSHAMRTFIGLVADDIGKWAAPENLNSPETASIRLVLNHYELMAIGYKLAH